MSNAVTVDIKGKNDQLKSALNESETVATKFGSQVAMSFATLGASIAAALSVQQIIAWGKELVSWTQDAVAAALEAESAMAKFEAVTRASGGASGATAEEIAALALEMQKLTKFNEEQVIEAASVLSIYQNINGEAFPRTIRLAADMAELFGGDLTSAIRGVGLALDSPTEGLSRLTRQGVKLDEEVVEMIKSLDAAGQTAEAQELIFAALEGRFLGVAEAMGETSAGRIERMTNRFGEMQETIGSKLIPILDDLFPLVETLAAGFEEMIDSIEGDIDTSGIEGLTDEMVRLTAQSKTYLDILKQVSVENAVAFGMGALGKTSFGKGVAAGLGAGNPIGIPDVDEITKENERAIRLRIELERSNQKITKDARAKAQEESRTKAKEIREAEEIDAKQFAEEQSRFDRQREANDAWFAEQAEKEKLKKKKDVKEKDKKEEKEKDKKDETVPEARFEALEALHQRIQSAAASGRPEEKVINKFAELFEPPIADLVAAEIEVKESIDALDATIQNDLLAALNGVSEKSPLVDLIAASNVSLSDISKSMTEYKSLENVSIKLQTDIKNEIGKVGKLY